MIEPNEPILEPDELIPNSVIAAPKASDMAVKDLSGRYLDPDSGAPVSFEVPAPPEDMGRDWTKRELRSMRRGNYPAFPHIAPEKAAAAERAALEESKAAAIAEIQEIATGWARLLRQPAANVDANGVAHSLVIYKDTESCSGCREPWPCTAAQKGARNDTSVKAEPGSIRPVDLETLADLKGVDPNVLDEDLRKRHPHEYR